MSTYSQIPNIQEYKGPQAVLTSDRLVFVSKNSENILFNSDGFIHMTSKEGVFLDIGYKEESDSTKMFVVNSPYIQFGLDKRGRTVEPVTKADALEETVNDQNDAVSTYSKLMDAAVAFPPLAVIASAYLKLKMNNVKTALAEPGNVKSDTVATI